MAQVLLGCYRKDEIHDPDTYCAAVGAVLSEYPRNVVDLVTDPRTGLPGRLKWLPSVAEVREACEDIYAPLRREAARQEDRNRRAREMTAEVGRPRGERPTYEELKQRCADAGLFIGGKKAAKKAKPVQKILEEYKISQKFWDSIQNAKR